MHRWFALIIACGTACRGPLGVDAGILDGAIAATDGPRQDGGRACAPLDPRSQPVEVGVQPDDSERAYVEAIARATKTIRVYSYLMGRGGILDGLKQKVAQGLDVRVILDVGQTANQKYFDELKAVGVKALWSDPIFPYAHAKVLIIDQLEAIVSTGNYSLSYIDKERNYTARTRDAQDVGDLITLFDADFARQAPRLPCTRLLVSPINAQQRLLDLIASARTTLIVHSMQLADRDIRAAVAARKQAGVDVRVLLAAPSWIDTNNDAATFLKGHSIPVRWLASPSVHVKALIVDGDAAYLGSINLSYTSLTKNREVGVLFRDRDGVTRMLTTFEKDWAAATAF